MVEALLHPHLDLLPCLPRHLRRLLERLRLELPLREKRVGGAHVHEDVQSMLVASMGVGGREDVRRVVLEPLCRRVCAGGRREVVGECFDAPRAFRGVAE